ncbi:MAG TPA: zf-HC2 domain-containing protein [Baekduia sp.]|nr:zf-HC2 domain-containing protein [Baekduia sp.]
MALSPSGIDHEGIGAGDPEALQQLIGARGDSVIAYCLELAGSQRAGHAAAEAMARFRAAIAVLGTESRVQTDVLLLAATRHAAAAFADLDTLWKPARIQHRDAHCERIPAMLAARALGQLSAPDLERVAKHLWRCEGCRLVEAAFARAEQAYRAPQVDPDADEAQLMLDTLMVATPAPAATPIVSKPQPPRIDARASGEPMQDILGEVEPSGFLDDARMDPRDRPTVILDVPDSEPVLVDTALVAPVSVDYEADQEGDADDDSEDFVPGRSATLAFSLLAMGAVIAVLAVTYAFDGMPGSG